MFKQTIAYRPLVIIAMLCMTLFTSCDDKEDPTPAQETGTLTDIDGNEYKTVKIGNQWWMAENLKVTTYANGELLYKKTTNPDWAEANAAYCKYDDKDDAPGLLYNYAAVTSSNQLAPQGWHIPTDDEWKELEKYLGMSQAEADKLTWRGSNEGDKLKIEGPEGWTSYENIWGSNESGFTALAGSCRLADGTFGQPGLFSTGFWWTATPHGDAEAFYRYLDKKNSNVFRSHVSKKYGMSVRCVKD